MKYLAAYLLVSQGGEQPTFQNIKATLAAVGVEAEESRVSELLASLKGKTLDQVIAEGNTKLASVPSGGAAAAPAAGAAAASGETEATAEEKEEESKEESDDDMGFGLFD